jgi:hypothetical protein
MPKFRVMLSVEGSDRFFVEAATLAEAEALADKLLSDGEWQSDRPDLEYAVVGVDPWPRPPS